MNYSTSVLTAAHTTPAWKRITLPKVQHIAAPNSLGGIPGRVYHECYPIQTQSNATLTVRHLLTKGV